MAKRVITALTLACAWIASTGLAQLGPAEASTRGRGGRTAVSATTAPAVGGANDQERRLAEAMQTLRTPGDDGELVNHKRSALAYIAYRQAMPQGIENLAMEALESASGDHLAVSVGDVLVRLGEPCRARVEAGVEGGSIPRQRAAVALKKLNQAAAARAEWSAEDGNRREMAFGRLLNLRGVTHEDLAKALVDRNEGVRRHAIAAASRMELTETERRQVYAMVNDPAKGVQAAVMSLRARDGGPAIAEDAASVFAKRYDNAFQASVVAWFGDHRITDASSVQQLMKDLDGPTQVRVQAVKLLRACDVETEKVLSTLATVASRDLSVQVRNEAMASLEEVLRRPVAEAKQGSQDRLRRVLTALLKEAALTDQVRDTLFSALWHAGIAAPELTDVFIGAVGGAKGSSEWAEMCLGLVLEVDQGEASAKVWKAQRPGDKWKEGRLRGFAGKYWRVWAAGLKEGDSSQRMDAMEQIRLLSAGAEVVPALVACMQDIDPAVRLKAMETLRFKLPGIGIAKYGEYQKLLWRVTIAATSATEVPMRCAALEFAGWLSGNMRQDGAGQVLLAATGDRDASVRACAWKTLYDGIDRGRLAEECAKLKGFDDALKKAIWSEDRQCRQTAVMIWGLVRRGEALPRPPMPVAVIVMLVLYGIWCVGAFALWVWGDFRTPGTSEREATRRERLENAVRGARATRVFLIAVSCVGVVGLLMGGRSAISVLGGMLLMMIVATGLTAQAIWAWGRLLRAGRDPEVIMVLLMMLLMVLGNGTALLRAVTELIAGNGETETWSMVTMMVIQVVLLGTGGYTVVQLCHAGFGGMQRKGTAGSSESQ